jgi:hypothetical protein
MSGSAGRDHPPVAPDLVPPPPPPPRPTPGLGVLALGAVSWAVLPAAALPGLVAEAEGVGAAADAGAGAGAGGRSAVEAGSARATAGGLGEGASCLRLVMKRSVLDLHRATMCCER